MNEPQIDQVVDEIANVVDGDLETWEDFAMGPVTLAEIKQDIKVILAKYACQCPGGSN